MSKPRFNTKEHPHRRFNPLTGQWVLVSPQRLSRPWAGAAASPDDTPRPSHDPDCPLCPGNERSSGVVNPAYTGTHVFANDFSALLPDGPDVGTESHHLLHAESARGETHVVCYSADHALTLAEMSEGAIAQVVDAWVGLVTQLAQDYAWVQVFENKGEAMGCSQPHPHGQVWASSFVPDAVAAKDDRLGRYHRDRGTNLILDYAEVEGSERIRIVEETEHWLALVPYWAAWPYETMLLPKTHVPRFQDLTAAQRADLPRALKRLTCRYDNLFACSFPYTMGWHFAPGQSGNNEHWQLHALFYPPLLRSSTVRKFMVGYEMLAEAQRDLTPEDAAARLREQPVQHYRASSE